MRRMTSSVNAALITALLAATAARADDTAIVIESATLRADDLSFNVRLETGVEISGTQNDIIFAPPTLLGTRNSGRPHCHVNDAIDKSGTSFAFQPNGCIPGESCTGVRALVFSLFALDPIPSDSVLYVCALAPGTPPGRYLLGCANPLASSPDGAPVPAACVDGEIEVIASTVLVAGSVYAQPGEIALVDVTAFTTEGTTHIETDLEVAGLPIRGVSSPACVAAEGVDATFAFAPDGCTPGGDCRALHAVAQSASGAPLSSGAVLFTCGVDVPSTAPVGEYGVSLSGASGTTASGGAAAMSVADGFVQIIDRRETPTATQAVAEETPTPASSRIEIGSATGAPGTRVGIAVTLHTSEVIGGVQNDLHFEPQAAIAVAPGGIPDCTVDPSLDWIDGPEFAFQPPACVPGLDCTGIRALLIAAEPLGAIPSGTVLYTCSIVIDPGVSGTAALTCDNSLGSTPQGEERDVSCSGGLIAIVAPLPTATALPAAQPTPTLPSGSSVNAASSGGGSCAIAPDSGGAWWLLPPLLLMRRRARRN